MRLFLDQMFREELAMQLRVLGHDVLRASECGLSRADDSQILAQAIEQKRILLTLDGHFGDWAILPLTHHCGVVRVRVHPATTDNVLRLCVSLFSTTTETQFLNRLVIVLPNRVRWVCTANG